MALPSCEGTQDLKGYHPSCLSLSIRKETLSKALQETFFISHWLEVHQSAMPKPIINIVRGAQVLVIHCMGWRIGSISLELHDMKAGSYVDKIGYYVRKKKKEEENAYWLGRPQACIKLNNHCLMLLLMIISLVQHLQLISLL